MIVLLPNCGFLSETSRMIAISRALEARGHATLVASHGGPYAHLLDEAGIRWERLEPQLDLAGSQAFLAAMLTWGRENKPMFTDDELRTAVRAETDLFRRVGATLAVIGFNLSTFISSQLAGIPIATSHGGSFVPPVLDRGICPVPVNPVEPRMTKLPRFIQRWLANHVPRWLKAPVADLNRCAIEHRVRPLPSLMALMCGDLTLVTDLPEVLGIPREDLEQWRPWRRSLWSTTTLRYTGPLFATLDRPVSDRVGAFLSGPDPVVLLSPTSVTTEHLRQLIAAVSAAGTRVLVAATVHEVSDLQNERVMIERVLPNHLVMPRVAAAVIMGGQGSVQTAMTAGTPFVGMPYHGEQELNVALAESRGMAIRLAPRDGGSERMTAAVRRLLAEPSFRESAQRVKSLYAGADGAAGCARAIIDYLDAKRDHRSTQTRGAAASSR